jgi:hypothetical protein
MMQRQYHKQNHNSADVPNNNLDNYLSRFFYFLIGGTNSWQNPKECQQVDSDVFSSSRRTSVESGIDSSCNEESSALSTRRGFAQRTKQRVRSTCTMKLLKRRFPPLQWVPSYSLHYALYDFLAGLTVAVSLYCKFGKKKMKNNNVINLLYLKLTSIPQSIAYAAVAGLPLEVIIQCAIFNS